jgi:hypothetical protein
MAERDGRRFYALLDFLAAIAVPRLQQEHRDHFSSYDLQWNPAGYQQNSAEKRVLVSDYILTNCEALATEVESGRHDRLFIATVGRRLTALDKTSIRGFCAHVEDDFYVVKHVPGQGSVFVQVGEIDKHRYVVEEEEDNKKSDSKPVGVRGNG